MSTIWTTEYINKLRYIMEYYYSEIKISKAVLPTILGINLKNITLGKGSRIYKNIQRMLLFI